MMKIAELKEKLNAEVVTIGGTEREIASWYAGDFLSHVMGRMPEQACWFTIMNNVNVAAVAALTEAVCVVLCEGVRPDAALTEKASASGLAIFCTELDIYGAIKASL